MARIARVACIVRPRIYPVRSRMIFQAEYLYNAFPNRLTLERFFYGNAFDVRSFRAMQPPDYIPQLVEVCAHATASSKSPTLQKSRSTPAAIAGVQRSVLCRFTKL